MSWRDIFVPAMVGVWLLAGVWYVWSEWHRPYPKAPSVYEQVQMTAKAQRLTRVIREQRFAEYQEACGAQNVCTKAVYPKARADEYTDAGDLVCCDYSKVEITD